MSVPTAAPVLASARDDSPTVTVLASGLNSPRHLHLGPGGLYVVEAGTGGPSCVTSGGTSFCEGETGSVTLVNRFGQLTLLSGLPSVEESRQGAGGPVAVTFDRGQLAVLFQDTLVNPDGTTGVQGPGASDFGKLVLMSPFDDRSDRDRSCSPDIAAFAAAHPQDPATLGGTPDETTYDSDPYDIVRYHGGFAIADAAANDVLWLSPECDLSVIARLPTVPETAPFGTINAQAVPTSLAVGPDGALYVGELRGVPSLPGTADVYRVAPGQAPVAVVTGLTAVTDIAFDHEGRLLVLEYNVGGLLSPPTVPGALLRADVSTGQFVMLPVTGLSSPTGLAVGHHDVVYISNNGTSSGTSNPSGEILKVTGLG